MNRFEEWMEINAPLLRHIIWPIPGLSWTVVASEAAARAQATVVEIMYITGASQMAVIDAMQRSVGNLDDLKRYAAQHGELPEDPPTRCV